MANQIVLVADEDAKNLQILKENLEASGFLVITAPNGNKAWEEIQRNPPNIILTEVNLSGLNGYQLLERLHADPNTASLPLIFLTNQREIQQRVRAFELGAKDYLIKPLHVKEVIAHIRMVIRRLERRKSEQFETYMKFSGRLDQLNLADLIETFGVERKTGILTMSNGRRTGHIYFRDGAVVNASLGDLKQESAIYQMFPWRRGYFNMVFRDIEVFDEISTSNLGLLLQGIKRAELREKLISQLSSPKTSFIVTPTFKLLIEKRKVGGDASSFIDLLDGHRDVEQIIDDSGLDDLIVLRRIVRLYQQGFIKPTIPPAIKPVIPEKLEPKTEKRSGIDIPQISEPSQEDYAAPSTSIISSTADDEFFDESLEQDEPEDEIKPIFERIEKERQKLIVPEDEEFISVMADAELKSDRLDEELADQEQFAFTVPTKDHDDLAAFSDQIFIDEELIRQQIEEDGRDAPEDIAAEIEAQQATIETPKEIIEVKPEPPKPSALEDRKQQHPPMIESEIKTHEQPMREASQAKNNIVIVSIDDDCKDELMDILTNDNFESKEIKELGGLQINFGKIGFDEFSQFNVISISVDKHFAPFLVSLKPRIMGLIFAFDCSQKNTWEYTKYLIHSFWEKFQIPYTIAVMNNLEQNTISMEVIRYQLHVTEEIPLLDWDPVDKTSVRELLKIITRSSQKLKPRKTQTMLDSLVKKVMV